jgi:large subunit ribosomal protein LP2
MELLLSQLSGKDITELIAAGREKFASVPCGSGGVAVAASAPVGGAGGASAAEKKEEKVEEEKEESDDVRTLSWHMSLLATFPALSFGKLFLTFVCIF